jgi:hypothetical protein
VVDQLEASPVTNVKGESTDMQYVRAFDPDKAVDADSPASVLKSFLIWKAR